METAPQNEVDADNLANALNARGLTELANTLTEAGYTDIVSLGSDEDKVRQAIKDAVGPSFKRTGEITTVVAVWTKWKADHETPVACPLTTLLGEQLRQIAAKLTEAGYREIVSLGSDEDKVRQAIRDAVGPLFTRTGEITAVVAVWTKWKADNETCVACPLTTILGEQLTHIAAKLTNKGYRDLKDLGGKGDKEEDVRKKINAAVGYAPPDKVGDTPPGEIDRVVQLWSDSQRKTGTILDLPALPAGEPLDLTQPTIKIAEVEYKIPSTFEASVGTSTDKFSTARELKPIEWAIIASRTGMLYALDMNKVAKAKASGADVLATEPALRWESSKADILEPLQRDGEIATEMSYTESVCNLVHSKVDKASLSIATQFCSASAQMSRSEKDAQLRTTKRLQLSGRYRFIYAKVKLNLCVVLSEEFIKALDFATARETPMGKEEALEAVFARFGHFVPDTVTLGGEMYFTSSRETTGDVNEVTVKSSVAAVVAAKFEEVGGEVGASHDDGVVDRKEIQQISENATAYVSGGQGYLAGNSKEWPKTTRDPNSWAIIGREGLTPLVSMLERSRNSHLIALCAKVNDIWRSRQRRIWDTFDPPTAYVVNPDMGGLPFIIRSDMGNQSVGLQAVVDGPDQPATVVSNNKLETNLSPAALGGLAWQLWYTGEVTAQGDAVYFIVECLTAASRIARVNQWNEKKKTLLETGLLSDIPKPLLRAQLVARLVEKSWCVFCVEAPPHLGPYVRPKNDPAAWTFSLAEQSGDLDSTKGIGYVIRNVANPSLVLGPVETAAGQVTLQDTQTMDTVTKKFPEPHSWYCQTLALTSGQGFYE